MEATIDIKDYEIDDFRLETYKTFFGGIKTRNVPLGKKKRYNVELTIIPTEEERAIILKYKLDELSVEEERKYSEEFLQQFEERNRVAYASLSAEMQHKLIDETNAEMRKEVKQTLLGEYFNNPYEKNFEVRQDAHSYADKLEKEILPLIKTQIDYYRLESVRRDKRTITL
jgi:hypothetical protein